MPELTITFPGGKPRSIKIKRWTKGMDDNLRRAMSDIWVFMERDMKKKLSKPQKYYTGKRSKRKQFASPSPFKDLRARSRDLMKSYGRGDSNTASEITKEGGLPALHFGTNLVYAPVHEFGSAKRNIPMRKTFRPTINKNKTKIYNALKKALRFK